jgi:iron-sulfur cluster repair protein YtfE (RIC family)
LIEKVCAAHGRNHLELLGIKPLFQALRHDLEPHMLKGEGATPADTGNTGRGTVCAMHDCGSVWRW